jgi:hypothetical protein
MLSPGRCERGRTRPERRCPTFRTSPSTGSPTTPLRHTAGRYRTLREAAPIVYLPANGLYAATGYEVVRAALRADDVLISGRGVGANSSINDAVCRGGARGAARACAGADARLGRVRSDQTCAPVSPRRRPPPALPPRAAARLSGFRSLRSSLRGRRTHRAVYPSLARCTRRSRASSRCWGPLP